MQFPSSGLKKSTAIYFSGELVHWEGLDCDMCLSIYKKILSLKPNNDWIRTSMVTLKHFINLKTWIKSVTQQNNVWVIKDEKNCKYTWILQAAELHCFSLKFPERMFYFIILVQFVLCFQNRILLQSLTSGDCLKWYNHFWKKITNMKHQMELCKMQLPLAAAKHDNKIIHSSYIEWK